MAGCECQWCPFRPCQLTPLCYTGIPPHVWHSQEHSYLARFTETQGISLESRTPLVHLVQGQSVLAGVGILVAVGITSALVEAVQDDILHVLCHNSVTGLLHTY